MRSATLGASRRCEQYLPLLLTPYTPCLGTVGARFWGVLIDFRGIFFDPMRSYNTYMARARVCFLFLAFVLAACSSPDAVDDLTAIDADVESAVSEQDASEPVSSDDASLDAARSEEEISAPEESATAAVSDESGSSEGSVTPLEAIDPDAAQATPVSNSTSAWISRVNMSAESIELTWATTDNAVEYQLHRVPLSPTPPAAEVMTAENLIHTTDGAGRFADDTVEAGTQYWYGIRSLSANGDILAHGWHRADAVTDLEPPAAPTVTASAQDGGTLIEWTVPDEGYELHSYRVLRVVDGAEPELVGITWNLDQLSLFDDMPLDSDDVVYQVTASDFHWNRSAPGQTELAAS